MNTQSVPDDAFTIDAGVLAGALDLVCPPGFLADVTIARVASNLVRLTTTDGHRLITTGVECDAPSDFAVVLPAKAVKALRKPTSGAVKIWAGLHSLHFCRGGEVEVFDANHGDCPPIIIQLLMGRTTQVSK